MPLGASKVGLFGAAGVSTGGDRGIMCGGYSYTTSGNIQGIDYITISSAANAADFGDMSSNDGGYAGCANGTDGGRAVWNCTKEPINHEYQYVTISTLGDAADFGNQNQIAGTTGAASNGSNDRGVYAAGRAPNNDPTNGDFIEYITISSTGDGTDFGNMTSGRSSHPSSSSNGTDERMVMAGGEGGSPSVQSTDEIDYLTISSTGNASDFGNLTTRQKGSGACSNDTNDRMLVGGGHTYSDGNTLSVYGSDVISYLTITSLGDSTDFGDLSDDRTNCTGMSNGTSERGVFAAGADYNGSWADRNTIDYVTISSTGNATDFGDVVATGSHFGGTSDSQA